MFSQNKDIFKNFDFSVMRIAFEDFYKESTSNEMIKNSDVIILASRWSEKYFDDIEKFQLFTKK